MDLEERLLGDLAGILRVSADLQGEPPDTPFVLRDQTFERFRVAAPGPLDDIRRGSLPPRRSRTAPVAVPSTRTAGRL